MKRVSLFVYVIAFAASALVMAETAWGQQAVYHTPPQAIVDLIKAPSPFTASVSPTRNQMLLYEAVRLPDISVLAKPMYRLAGLRIDPANNGPHAPQRYVNWQLVDLATGASRPVALPQNMYAGAPLWSPDGRRFVFLDYSPHAVQLWIGDAASGTVHRLGTLDVNAVIEPPAYGRVPAGAGPVVWMPDSQHLLVRMVPAGRVGPPAAPAVASGPIVMETDAHPAPNWTYEDLLKNPHDADLFTYFTTSQLGIVDATSSRTQLIGHPAIIATNAPSPDGHHILVVRIHRPYSYLVNQNEFPRIVEVWSLSGRMEYHLADLPLANHTPINGQSAGPRDYGWMPARPATLAWVQALGSGNPHVAAAFRDQVLALSAPFSGVPIELVKTVDRTRGGVEWGSAGDLGIVRSIVWRTATVRTLFFDPHHPGQPPRVAWTLNTKTEYGNPGTFVEATMTNGQQAVLETRGAVFLTGVGASPSGDHSFLDRLDLRTLRKQRLFQSSGHQYETVETLLAPNGSRFLTERQTPTDPPNYYVRSVSGKNRAVSHFVEPPAVARMIHSIHSELVTYQRADGVKLSMTIYLPPDYKPGVHYPAVMVGYPLYYATAKLAGQVTGSPYRFPTFPVFGAASGDTGGPLYLLFHGYVILNDTSMPIVGPPRTVNDTFVPQLVADAKAAIDKAAAMGIIDPNRVGVTGHSYGAFMTANVMAHSTLFRAGVAQSGAYNRTLTPFGFQVERRTFWQAEHAYESVSPFFFANRIKEPLMLINGIDGTNPGTFPMQSKRMYMALEGNGDIVRWVQLPYEAHIYIGRQSIEEVEWEMMTWFDKYVKNAPARAAVTVDFPGLKSEFLP